MSTKRLWNKKIIPKRPKQRRLKDLMKDETCEVDGANVTVCIKGIAYTYKVEDL